MPVAICIVPSSAFGAWKSRVDHQTYRVVLLTDDALVTAEAHDDLRLTCISVTQRLQIALVQYAEAINALFSVEGAGRDALTWWGSQHASRSVSATSAPLDICRALVARDLLREANETDLLAFVVDCPTLGSVIARLARENGYSATRFGKMRSFLTNGLLRLRPALAAARFLVVSLGRWITAHRRLRSGPVRGRHIVVIRSWCSTDNLSPDGRYVDRNFGALTTRLAATGHDVWITPCFFRLTEPFQEVLRRCDSSETNFLIVERYVSPVDILVQSWRGFREGAFGRDDAQIDGCIVSPILRTSARRAAASLDLMMYNLLFAALRRLRDNGVSVSRMYYPMENNAFEKLPLLAMRRFHPRGESIGFQHSVWFRGQPSMRLLPAEATEHPLPDTILYTGARYLDILTQSGFPADRLEPSPSFRFLYALSALARLATTGTHGSLLVLPGFNSHHANDTLLRVLKAVQFNAQHETVLIKPHPTSDLYTMRRIANRFPSIECRFVEGNVAEWVDCVEMVIESGGSVAALETMLLGRPVIRSAPSASYFLDPFWDAYPIPVVHDAEELGRAILDVRASRYPASAFEAVAGIVHDRYFAPDDGGVPPSSNHFLARS